MYKCTIVQMYNCSNVKLFKCKIVQMYNCTKLQSYNCTNVYRTNVQMCKYNIVEEYKCTYLSIYKYKKIQTCKMYKSWICFCLRHCVNWLGRSNTGPPLLEYIFLLIPNIPMTISFKVSIVGISVFSKTCWILNFTAI